MVIYVLVQDAWHGGWRWQRVTPFTAQVGVRSLPLGRMGTAEDIGYAVLHTSK